MTTQHVNAKISEIVKDLTTNVGDTFLFNPTVAVITTAGVFVPIGGTSWLSDILERFTSDNTGKLNSSGQFPFMVFCIITATMEKVGGGADLAELAVAIDSVERTKTVSGTKNKDPSTLTSLGAFNIQEGSTIQAFVANVDTTANILVSSGALTVFKVSLIED